MKNKLLKYQFVGIIHTAIVKFDVNTTLLAYSEKQARLKLFYQLKQINYFKDMPNTVLIGKIRKLKIIKHDVKQKKENRNHTR